MKLVAKYFLSFCFVITGNYYAQDCKAKFRIETNESTSLILINDVFLGKGSVDAELAIGSYQVTIRESLTKWNGYEINDTINILACNESYSKRFDVAQNVFINSSPQNIALVFRDSTIGYTPQYINSKYLEGLELKKGNSIIPVNMDLMLKNKFQKIDYESAVTKTKFTDSDLFKILLGSATALGAAAAYFKLQADKKYDNYLITKNPATIDEVDRLDTYSGVALGLLQINIGYLIYKFLTD